MFNMEMKISHIPELLCVVNIIVSMISVEYMRVMSFKIYNNFKDEYKNSRCHDISPRI